jgi:hypothetical protein
MNTFKTGDKVLCVDIRDTPFSKDKEYTVLQYTEGDSEIFLEEDESWYPAEKFIKVGDAQ